MKCFKKDKSETYRGGEWVFLETMQQSKMDTIKFIIRYIFPMNESMICCRYSSMGDKILHVKGKYNVTKVRQNTSITYPREEVLHELKLKISNPFEIVQMY